MAEVSLTMVNNRGVLPVEYSEISIARRTFRNGSSEYYLNRQPCRLRDLRDLFLDTGMGSHAYSLIERGMVDNVLSDESGHRRFLFEEAAGIMRYKTRKKEALQKLDLTLTDLTRVTDVMGRSLLADADVSRLGGDEFTAILPTAKAEEAREPAVRLLRVFERPFDLGGRKIPLAARAGVAVSTPALASAEALLQAADLAVSRTKSGGGGSICFFDP